jgi:hypothetical protein
MLSICSKPASGKMGYYDEDGKTKKLLLKTIKFSRLTSRFSIIGIILSSAQMESTQRN